MPKFYYSATKGEEGVVCKVCRGSGKYYYPPVYGDDSEYKCKYCKGKGNVPRIIDIKLKLEHGDYGVNDSDIVYLLGKVEEGDNTERGKRTEEALYNLIAVVKPIERFIEIQLPSTGDAEDLVKARIEAEAVLGVDAQKTEDVPERAV